jgi:rod shape-determining protein MreD
MVLDNIQLSGYLNPYFYLLFILLMPIDTPKWLLLISGFILGITIDFYSNTLGMHTAATVFLAFSRPWILTIIAPRDGYETDASPTILNYGFRWFATYTIILTFFHHFLLFYIEAFHFHSFFTTFLRVFLSTVLTASTIILSQYFIFRR